MTRTSGSLQAVQSKLGYRFAPIPCPEAVTPRFFRLSVEAQNLCLRIAWFEGKHGIRVEEDDWERDLLRTLEISGRGRGNATRHLHAMVKAGVLQIGDGLARVALDPRDVANDVRADVHATSIEHPPDIRLHSTTRNDSTPIPQTRLDQINLREERAREEQASHQVSEPEPPPAHLPRYEVSEAEHAVRVEFEQAYFERVCHPPNAKMVGKAMPELREFVQREAARSKCEVGLVAKKLVAGFFASSKAAKAAYPIAFLATNPHEYYGIAADGGGSFQSPAEAAKAKYDKLHAEFNAMRGRPPEDPERKAAFARAMAAAEECKRLREGRAA